MWDTFSLGDSIFWGWFSFSSYLRDLRSVLLIDFTCLLRCLLLFYSVITVTCE